MLNSDGSSFAASSKTPSTTNDQSAQITDLRPARDHDSKDKLDINFRYLEVLARLGQQEQDGFPDLTADRSRSSNSEDPAVATSAGDCVVIPIDEEPLTAQEGSAQARPDPNRFSFFSSALECTIHVSRFGDLVLPGDSISTLFNFQDDDSDEGVWWLNVNNPSHEQIRAICLAFGIHPLTLEDIDTKETREKIELFPSYYFASFRSFKVLQQPGSVKYAAFSVYVVVFREGTISFSFTPNNHASQVRSRIAMLKEHVSISSDWICYALM
jgi:magnesium transporter